MSDSTYPYTETTNSEETGYYETPPEETEYYETPPVADGSTLDLPAPPSEPDLVAISDSGSSDSDNYTNDGTPTFSGTADAGSTVELFADGISLGTTTADANGVGRSRLMRLLMAITPLLLPRRPLKKADRQRNEHHPGCLSGQPSGGKK